MPRRQRTLFFESPTLIVQIAVIVLKACAFGMGPKTHPDQRSTSSGIAVSVRTTPQNRSLNKRAKWIIRQARELRASQPAWTVRAFNQAIGQVFPMQESQFEVIPF
jgi:hypothetical protein